MTRSFRLYEPTARTSCAVFSSPHSGRFYPDDFLRSATLDAKCIRSSEDAFVDELFNCAPQHGAPLISAVYPRAYVDLNRGAEELDPALISGTLRRSTNPRVSAGLGVIPRVVAEGKSIRSGKITMQEAIERLQVGYHPYHTELSKLLDEQRAAFNLAILFDCHSMPHDALASLPTGQMRPHVVLGDRFGASCARWIVDAVADSFTDAGFVVVRNTPFAGGFITQNYGRPARNMHALQIEIDRSLYMDETAVRPNAQFERCREQLQHVVRNLCGIAPLAAGLAAE